MHRPFKGKDELEKAREKAEDIMSKSVLHMFDTQQYQEKDPFPSLETLTALYEVDVEHVPLGQGIDNEIFDSLTTKHLNISPNWYSFLRTTPTIKNLKIWGKPHRSFATQN